MLFNYVGTLIRPKSNDVLPEEADDWEFLDNVEDLLKEYVEKGYVIVVTANLPGIEKKLISLDVHNAVIDEIGKKLGVKPGKNFFRFIADSKTSPLYKPSVEIYNELKKEINVDIEDSTVIGDTWSDAQFAATINLPFIQANRFFNWSETVTIFVGFPASRKTTYCKEFHGFDVRVCIEDINKSMSQEFKLEWKRLYSSVEEKMILEALRYRLDIVIDRTNLDKKRRRRFLDIVDDFRNSPGAQEIKIICKHFDIPFEVCKERYLSARDWTQIEKIEIEDFFERMSSEFEKPSLKEGFDRIVVLPKEFLLEMF